MGNETINIENIEVGENVPQVTAKKVKVISLKTEMVKTKDTQKDVGNKLTLVCQHPDLPAPQTIDISGVKYIYQEKIKATGLWIKLDKDGKLGYNSSISILLRFLNLKTPKELVGKELDTVADDNNYLIIKAY